MSAAETSREQREGPMDGLTVLDLSYYGSAPIGAMMLGDLGADVIKVEPPGGDPFRRLGVTFPGGWSTFFLAVSRNKRFLSVDFKKEEGAALLRSLAERADILIENHRPGGWDPFGLGYEHLAETNPELIYVSVSGFGREGEMKDWVAMDPVAQAAGGIMSMTGELGGAPVKVGAPIADVGAGRLVALGTSVALLDRAKTGRGQHVEISLLGAVVSNLNMRETEYWFSREVPRPLGTSHGQVSPAAVFQTADERSIMVTLYDHQFRTWCEAAGAAELVADERFDTNAKRKANEPELFRLMQEVFSRRTQAEWDEALQGVVPYTPVLAMDQLIDHPQVLTNELYIDYDLPDVGPVRAVGVPVKFSAFKPSARFVPREPGADSVAVLSDQGIDRARIDELIRDDVVITTEEAVASVATGEEAG